MADSPQMNPINFLLNRNAPGMVGAPAFSITKVLATLATVATPLAALLVAKIGSVDFSSWGDRHPCSRGSWVSRDSECGRRLRTSGGHEVDDRRRRRIDR